MAKESKDYQQGNHLVYLKPSYRHLILYPLIYFDPGPNNELNIRQPRCGRNARSGFWGSTPLPSGIGVEKQGAAAKFYGLGIMNIVPLRGMTDLTTRVWVRSLDTVLGRC